MTRPGYPSLSCRKAKSQPVTSIRSSSLTPLSARDEAIAASVHSEAGDALKVLSVDITMVGGCSGIIDPAESFTVYLFWNAITETR